MDVRVDEAGHQCGFAEIDYLGSGRMRNRLACFGNAVASDEDFSRTNECASLDVEKVVRV